MRAIVIPTYDRPRSLGRLLDSLAAVVPGKGAWELVLSCEGDAAPGVRRLAAEFVWPHGPKRVVDQSTHLGLREHLLWCGDQVFGREAVLVLEDDLFVSPHLLTFAEAALARYAGEPSLAGISLYAPSFSETTRLPFLPADDGYDAYCLAMPSSWGEIWWPEAWSAFRAWQRDPDRRDPASPRLPANVAGWSEQSWKKQVFAWMMETGRTFLYPRLSLTTNFGEPGVHCTGSHAFQVPLQGEPREYRLPPLEARGGVRYDAHGEREPESLRGVLGLGEDQPLIVDLHGEKRLGGDEVGSWCLTAKRLSSPPRASFGRRLKPIESNVFAGIPGDDLHLYRLTATDIAVAAPPEALDRDELDYWYSLKPHRLRAVQRLRARVGELETRLRDLGPLRHLRFLGLLRKLGERRGQMPSVPSPHPVPASPPRILRSASPAAPPPSEPAPVATAEHGR